MTRPSYDALQEALRKVTNALDNVPSSPLHGRVTRESIANRRALVVEARALLAQTGEPLPREPVPAFHTSVKFRSLPLTPATPVTPDHPGNPPIILHSRQGQVVFLTQGYAGAYNALADFNRAFPDMHLTMATLLDAVHLP